MEIENFPKRESREKVSRNEAVQHRSKIIPCKWVFKIKHKFNNTIRYKARLCVKGFHQVAVVDYTKSFSPVANSSTIAILLSTTLHMEDQGWTCKMSDAEAAFLNTELETPMYLEWPKSMREVRFIIVEEEENKFIKLVRLMYSNVDAALRWQKIFVKL